MGVSAPAEGSPSVHLSVLFGPSADCVLLAHSGSGKPVLSLLIEHSCLPETPSHTQKQCLPALRAALSPATMTQKLDHHGKASRSS